MNEINRARDEYQRGMDAAFEDYRKSVKESARKIVRRFVILGAIAVFVVSVLEVVAMQLLRK